MRSRAVIPALGALAAAVFVVVAIVLVLPRDEFSMTIAADGRSFEASALLRDEASPRWFADAMAQRAADAGWDAFVVSEVRMTLCEFGDGRSGLPIALKGRLADAGAGAARADMCVVVRDGAGEVRAECSESMSKHLMVG